jgi:hypothetical protein
MGDERLIDAFDTTGCPLCAFVRRAGHDYLGSVLSDHVNDRQFRRRFTDTGGFCPRHTHDAADIERRRSGGVLGAAILYRSTLGARREALARALGGTRPSERKLRDAVAPARACLACEQEIIAERDAVSRLTEHAAADGGWHDALAHGPWCIGHIATLATSLAAERRSDLLATFSAGQVDRLAELDGRLERFIHHSASDRREQQTADERAAVEETRQLLAGASTDQR